jgi:predicted outer membrane repeat protein
MWRVVLLSCGILAFAVPAFADTYVVHPDGTGDFPTIQAAIDAAVDGDIIELTDGTFTGDGNRDTDFLGKAITVMSQSGNPHACAIDCQGTAQEPHRAFTFSTREESGSHLDGLTITHGYATWGGGGVLIDEESSPTISNCVLVDNFAENNGAALRSSWGCYPTVTSCEFRHNSTAGVGGACSFADGFGTFTECRFEENSAAMWGGAINIWIGGPNFYDCVFVRNSAGTFGGAIANDISYWGAVISRCVFIGNTATDGGTLSLQGSAVPEITMSTIFGSMTQGAAIRCSGEWCAPTISNTIVAFSADGGAVACDGGAAPALSCCDIYGNAGGNWVGGIEDQYGIDGNISEDPVFCDPDNGDFTLQECSPCAPFSPPNPECDLIGAWPVGCGGTPVTRDTWGGVKALFRR